MVDGIADGDTVLMEPVNTLTALKNGTIVSAYVVSATLKYYNFKNQSIYSIQIIALVLNPENVIIQGKLLAVWRSLRFSSKF